LPVLRVGGQLGCGGSDGTEPKTYCCWGVWAAAVAARVACTSRSRKILNVFDTWSDAEETGA
jgi:hypothetical protein